MNLLYDHQIFDLQRYGGISRYFCELMRVYASKGEPHFTLACPYTTNAYLWEAEFLCLNTPVTRRRYRGSGVVNNLLARRHNRPASVRALHAGDYDLFHPTYYDPYFLEHLGDKPFVLTVHDMIHERHPDCYAPDEGTSDRKRLLVERASHVIAVSESTRSDLIDLFKTPADKITVIYHGCSLLPDPGPRLPHLPRQYLLYVGERSRYKNFAFALRALAPLFREHPDVHLLCAGGGPFTGEESALMAELAIDDRSLQVHLDDRGLAAAYRGAVALVFPSLCEGFGIPVLEAFACGCPVLASNRSSLPEVGGEAALYFDPENGEELLSQAARLLSDPSLRQELAAAGRERVKGFTWERAALETRGVYERVVQGRGGRRD